MNKLQDLRAYLLHRLPELNQGPDRLLTFIDNGQIEFWQGENLSHKLIMPVKIIVTDWRGTADDLIIPILEWLKVRQPNRDPKTSIAFESEIINSETLDLMFTLNLTERVIVKGSQAPYEIEHVLPPMPDQMNPNAALELNTHSTAGDQMQNQQQQTNP